MKNETIIYIDTSSNKEISVGLRINGKEDLVCEEIGREKAQVVLPMIEKLLKKHELELKDISGIEVNEGPGSFTGLRVGISIANALAYSLKIPVNGKKIGVFAGAKYE